jgi:hypothetical protein
MSVIEKPLKKHNKNIEKLPPNDSSTQSAFTYKNLKTGWTEELITPNSGASWRERDAGAPKERSEQKPWRGSRDQKRSLCEKEAQSRWRSEIVLERIEIRTGTLATENESGALVLEKRIDQPEWRPWRDLLQEQHRPGDLAVRSSRGSENRLRKKTSSRELRKQRKKIWRTLWLWDRAKPGQTSTLQETRKKTKKSSGGSSKNQRDPKQESGPNHKNNQIKNETNFLLD